MNDTLPEQPIRSSISTTESKDFPGQIITYTCNTGFEFVGDPEVASVSAPETTTTTTTTTTMSTLEPWSTLTWSTYKGAEYAMGIENFDVTWNEARQRCQSEGADLASISSYDIQRKVNQGYTKDGGVWLGGTDAATEGTFTWTDGLAWEYHNFPGCSLPSGSDNDNTMNCVKMDGDQNNKWKAEDCNAAGIRKYICMKGSSTSPFWFPIQSAEYSLIKGNCWNNWDGAKAECQNFGGEIASITSQEVKDALDAHFGDHVPTKTWIGLNDKANEGTYVWDKGETFQWSNWHNNEPDNDGDCVRISNSFKFLVIDCGNTDVKAVFCMRGDLPTTAAASGTISNSVTGKWDKGKCDIGGFSDDSSGGQTLSGCCNRCASFAATDKVTVKSKDGKKCYCIDTDKSDCTSGKFSSSNDYESADCAVSAGRKRKKRQVLLKERYKRQASVDLVTQREIKCESIWNGEGGYWSYTHEVPKYCFSKS